MDTFLGNFELSPGSYRASSFPRHLHFLVSAQMKGRPSRPVKLPQYGSPEKLGDIAGLQKLGKAASTHAWALERG